MSSIQFIDHVLSEVEGHVHLLRTFWLSRQLLLLPVPSALPWFTHREGGIFRCPTCPKTNAQEEAGKLEAASQLPQLPTHSQGQRGHENLDKQGRGTQE